MCKTVNLSHIYPHHVCVTNPISRNVRIVGSAVVTSWQAVRSNNTASAPVFSWLHQRRDTRALDQWRPHEPCFLLALWVFQHSKQLIFLNHRVPTNCLICTPSDHAALNQINLSAGNKRQPALMNDPTQNKTSDSWPAWCGLRSTGRNKWLDCLQRDKSIAWG